MSSRAGEKVKAPYAGDVSMNRTIENAATLFSGFSDL